MCILNEGTKKTLEYTAPISVKKLIIPPPLPPPAGPVGPGGPVIPIPVGPAGPVTPIVPVGPVGPVEPLPPTAPSGLYTLNQKACSLFCNPLLTTPGNPLPLTPPFNHFTKWLLTS